MSSNIAVVAFPFMMVFLPLTGTLDPALAQDSKPSQPTSQSDSSYRVKAWDSYSVKAWDLSHDTNREARHHTVRVSDGTIIILYQGSNKELMQQVVAGASEAKDGVHGHEPVYVGGMIIGKANPSFKGGADSFVLYVDGYPVTDPADARINPKQTVKELLVMAEKTFIQIMAEKKLLQTRAGARVDHPGAPTGLAQNGKSVPMKDARAASIDWVQALGIRQSSNHEIVIIFYGQDRNLFNDAKEAAREAIADGLPVRGMVFGPPVNQSSGIEIFANGFLVNRSDIEWDKETISMAIKLANTEYVQSGRFDFAPKVTR